MPGLPEALKGIQLRPLPPTGSNVALPSGTYVVPAGTDNQFLISDSTTPTGFNFTSNLVATSAYISGNLTATTITASSAKITNIYGTKTLQFVSGALLSPVLTGAVEFDGEDIFYTTTGSARRNITARPFISVFDTGSHIVTSVTSAYNITYNTLESSNDITLQNNSEIHFNHSFTYTITFSIQFINAQNNVVNDAFIWLAKNGSNMDNTNSVISIPGAHSGQSGSAIATVNFVKYFESGSYMELKWATNSTNVSVQTVPSATSPTRPAAPGVILTIFRVND